MALKLPKELEVLDGPQPIRQTEGLVFSVDVAKQTSSTPSSATVTIIRQADEADVTATLMAVNTPSIATTVITLDEILIPADAILGDYVVNVEFEAGGYSPGRVYFIIRVYE